MYIKGTLVSSIIIFSFPKIELLEKVDIKEL